MFQPRPFFFLTPVLCALALAMAGCSKSGSGFMSGSSAAPSSTPGPAPQNPAGTSSTSGPCALLTQAEVESVLGKGATMSANANPRTGMDECKLKPAPGTDLDELVIVVHDTTPESWLMVKKGYMQDKKVKQVRKLGDDAINLGGSAGIFARKGDKYVQIFGSLKPERDEKAELYLLQQAVSRL